MTSKLSAISALVLSIAVFIWLLYEWVITNFGNVSAFEIFLTLTWGLEGTPTVQTSKSQIVLNVLAPSFLVGIATFIVLEKIKSIKGKRMLVTTSALILSTSLLGLSTNQVMLAIDLNRYLTFDNLGLSIKDFDPKFETEDLVRTPNLILIYVESLEESFSSSEIYGENLLSELDEATKDFMFGTEVWQAPLAGNTLAALTASFCGFSVVGVLDSDSEVRPEARDNCLGSILGRAGYTNVFLGGALGSSYGKENLVLGSGYDRFFGLSEWKEMGYTHEDLSVWGLWDKDLFLEARNTLRDLENSPQPFNLTILTVDTHAPGSLDPRCDSAGQNLTKRVIKCTASEVADFINYARGFEFYNETVIVVIGDHAFMGRTEEEKIAGINPTSVYFRIKPVVSDNWPPLSSRGTLYDIGPTVLQTLSGEKRSHRLGFGVSLLSINREKSIFDKYSLAPKTLTQILLLDPYAIQSPR
jgi:phosphoglycerol transferase